MNRRGFTLIEVLVVIVVIVILAGMSFGLWSLAVEVPRRNLTESRVHALGCEVRKHFMLTGQYPAALANLAFAVDHPEGLLDGWERPIEFQVQGREFSLWSLGSSVTDGSDDIRFLKN